MTTVRRVPGRFPYEDVLVITTAGDMWRRLMEHGDEGHDAWEQLLRPIEQLAWEQWLV